jgi:glucosamine 6-phosphate synthetase-like amidotransferase/phosphosugar isomerase protein|tara:strand:+ start:1 stop:891 length:891 start_codon:yes stop_codon:yes gene_type:complete
MCGILGVKINKVSEKVPKNLLRIFKNQKDRGTDGAGLSLLRDGQLTRIRTADPFDLFSFEYGKFWNTLQKGDCILVHHRFPTNGGDGNSLRSNHPFANEDNKCHLIHNGVVSNDDKLFKQLRKQGHRFESKVEGSITDSEVLVHMVEKDAKGGCQRIVDKAQGSIAIAFQYANDNKIYLWRRTNPIEVYSDKGGNQYFSSEFPEGKGFTKIQELGEHKLYALGDGLKVVHKYKKPKVEKYQGWTYTQMDEDDVAWWKRFNKGRNKDQRLDNDEDIENSLYEKEKSQYDRFGFRRMN